MVLDLGSLELELSEELDDSLDEEMDEEDLILLEELLETFLLDEDFDLLEDELLMATLFEKLRIVLVEREKELDISLVEEYTMISMELELLLSSDALDTSSEQAPPMMPQKIKMKYKYQFLFIL